MYKIDKGLDGIVRINGDEFVVKELIGIEDNSFRQYEEYSVDHQCCRQCVPRFPLFRFKFCVYDQNVDFIDFFDLLKKHRFDLIVNNYVYSGCYAESWQCRTIFAEGLDYLDKSKGIEVICCSDKCDVETKGNVNGG